MLITRFKNFLLSGLLSIFMILVLSVDGSAQSAVK